ncbi:MAG: cellulase family glycosylhydrolase [Lachnospiraceae bacterium]|nr:cellulase family glycosylhydrolase [Lachnospiraceae bacterium]
MELFEGFTHGINLGGWLSQNDDTSKNHYDTFITEKDIVYIASLGLDHVRVPVDYMLIEDEDGTIKPEGHAYIETCIKWCMDNHLHMILDIHKTYGYSFDPLDITDKKIFFYDETKQERFYAMWRELAKRYGKYHDMLAFELLNEIVEPEVADAWNKVAIKAIREIRTIAPETWIIYGGTMYNSVASVPGLVAPEEKKVVWTFHSYEPLIFTHQGAYWVKDMLPDFRIKYPVTIEEYRESSKRLAPQLAGGIFNDKFKELGPQFFETMLQPAIEYAQKNNMPLYCGEYGVIDLADDESKVRWAADICSVFDKHNIGRAYWNYKEKDFGIVNIEDKDIQKKMASLL